MRSLMIMIMLLGLNVNSNAISADRQHEDDRMPHHVNYQPLPLDVAHDDQQLVTMFERINMLGIAASHGDYPAMTSIVSGNDAENEPQTSQIELKLIFKANHLAHVEIRNAVTAAFVSMNFRENGTASQYVEANIDGSTKGLMRIVSIRENGTPETMSTGNVEMKPQGRQIRWSTEGAIESDKLLP